MIHGDAAFAAEGVVAETLNMARLPGYTVGGAIHIIANNQIGFTTGPADGRSTRYASDVAKGYDFPIIHVNADRPDACLAAMRLAMAYRREYHDDVVLDLVGYRRHGHNEGDEPAYTQPMQYAKISDHPTVRTQWARRLVESGTITQADADGVEEAVVQTLRGAQDRVKGEGEGAVPEPKIRPERQEEFEEMVPDTSVDLETLMKVNDASVEVPEDFNVHPKLKRQLAKRHTEFGPETRLDWAYAEALAFGSLLLDGPRSASPGRTPSAGPSATGTSCSTTRRPGRPHPLSALEQGGLEVFNSPLTEAGGDGLRVRLLGGHATDLVLWEGQFGDFVNVAQVAIDQFISAGREKWGQVQQPHPPPPPRDGGTGTGALLGPPGALPPAVRRGQHAGRLPHHAGPVLPPAPPPGAEPAPSGR
jgi:2-oxoglutarate dehydrogenase complex dehydrogenase (E1) component-like enzyme